MSANVEALNEVVVTALGIKREQKGLSYNVQQVKSDQLTNVKDANFINSLNGKVAGVNINSSSSGVGGASKVVMRGTKSIEQSSNALYVIDGIPMFNFGGGGSMENGSQGVTESIADINPDDIESISVLTGAAAPPFMEVMRQMEPSLLIRNVAKLVNCRFLCLVIPNSLNHSYFHIFKIAMVQAVREKQG